MGLWTNCREERSDNLIGFGCTGFGLRLIGRRFQMGWMSEGGEVFIIETGSPTSPVFGRSVGTEESKIVWV